MLISFIDRHKLYIFHRHQARGSPLRGEKVENFGNFSRFFGPETPNIHGLAKPEVQFQYMGRPFSLSGRSKLSHGLSYLFEIWCYMIFFVTIF